MFQRDPKGTCYSNMFHFDLSGPLSLDDFYGHQPEKILTCRWGEMTTNIEAEMADAARKSALSFEVSLQWPEVPVMDIS